MSRVTLKKEKQLYLQKSYQSKRLNWFHFFLINQGALFQSPHIDENDVQTISHKCEVLSYTEYGKTQRPDSHVTKETDVYYLAGTYEPTIGLLKFEKDVM